MLVHMPGCSARLTNVSCKSLLRINVMPRADNMMGPRVSISTSKQVSLITNAIFTSAHIGKFVVAKFAIT